MFAFVGMVCFCNVLLKEDSDYTTGSKELNLQYGIKPEGMNDKKGGKQSEKDYFI